MSFRHHIVTLGKDEERNKLQLRVVKATAVTNFLYISTFITVTSLLDLPAVVGIEYCVYGEKSRDPSPAIAFFVVPMLAATFTAVTFDIKTYFYIRTSTIIPKKKTQGNIGNNIK